jgi:hypothetical protein
MNISCSPDRKSLCTGKPNTYGHCLLDFCRKNNIYIVNGRVDMSVSLLSWIKQSINSSRLLGSQFAALSGFGDLSVWSRLPTTFPVHFRVIFDLISYMYDYENLLRANIPLDRKSLCTGKPNTYGHCLLDFCRKNNIYIV